MYIIKDDDRVCNTCYDKEFADSDYVRQKEKANRSWYMTLPQFVALSQAIPIPTKK